VSKNVLVRVDFCCLLWVLISKQKWSRVPILVKLNGLANNYEVLLVLKNAGRKDFPIRPMIQIMISDKKDNRNTEGIEAAARLVRVVEGSNIDGISVLKEVAKKSDVRWLLFFNNFNQPIDIIKIVKIVLVRIISCSKMDIGPKNQFGYFT
jgi:hypothetical protein